MLSCRRREPISHECTHQHVRESTSLPSCDSSFKCNIRISVANKFTYLSVSSISLCIYAHFLPSFSSAVTQTISSSTTAQQTSNLTPRGHKPLPKTERKSKRNFIRFSRPVITDGRYDNLVSENCGVPPLQPRLQKQPALTYDYS